ncbi:maltase-glucoamylase, intestinal protein [Wolffia australiana]
MAHEEQEKRELLSTSFAQFVEVLCKSTEKTWRFALGTTAGWALEQMNRSLRHGLPQGFFIVAVKEGEEQVVFGPSAVLSLFGHGWRLQTVTDEDLGGRKSSGIAAAASDKFVEVKCSSTGKVWRFAAGTKAGYALLRMNQELELGLPLAVGIEGVNDGEGSVKFGPDAILIDYGPRWSFRTAFHEGYGQTRSTSGSQSDLSQKGVIKPDGSFTMQHITPEYIGRILVVTFFLFLLGGLLTLFLEFLPDLLSIISSLT